LNRLICSIDEGPRHQKRAVATHLMGFMLKLIWRQFWVQAILMGIANQMSSVADTHR